MKSWDSVWATNSQEQNGEAKLGVSLSPTLSVLVCPLTMKSVKNCTWEYPEGRKKGGGEKERKWLWTTFFFKQNCESDKHNTEGVTALLLMPESKGRFWLKLRNRETLQKLQKW